MAMRENEIPSLQEWLDQEQGVNDESFKVDSEESADWVLRKLRGIEEQWKEDTSLAEAEIARVEAWHDKKREKYERDRDYFEGLLAQYAIVRRNADPKFKSLGLPNGRIRFKKQQPAFHYVDDRLVKALKAQGRTDLIKVKESPDKTELKKQFTRNGDKLFNPDTGEVLDGVTVKERDDKFEWGVE